VARSAVLELSAQTAPRLASRCGLKRRQVSPSTPAAPPFRASPSPRPPPSSSADTPCPPEESTFLSPVGLSQSASLSAVVRSGLSLRELVPPSTLLTRSAGSSQPPWQPPSPAHWPPPQRSPDFRQACGTTRLSDDSARLASTSLSTYRVAYPSASRERADPPGVTSRSSVPVPPAQTWYDGWVRERLRCHSASRTCPPLADRFIPGVAPANYGPGTSTQAPSDPTSRWTPLPPESFKESGCSPPWRLRFRLRARLGFSIRLPLSGRRGGCVRQVVQKGDRGRGHVIRRLGAGLLLLLGEQGHVEVTVLFQPGFVGLDAQRQHQAQTTGRVREDAHDPGAPLDLLVQTLEQVGALQVLLVLAWQPVKVRVSPMCVSTSR